MHPQNGRKAHLILQRVKPMKSKVEIGVKALEAIERDMVLLHLPRYQHLAQNPLAQHISRS